VLDRRSRETLAQDIIRRSNIHCYTVDSLMARATSCGRPKNNVQRRQIGHIHTRRIVPALLDLFTLFKHRWL